jgi:hypothetical protein
MSSLEPTCDRGVDRAHAEPVAPPLQILSYWQNCLHINKTSVWLLDGDDSVVEDRYVVPATFLLRNVVRAANQEPRDLGSPYTDTPDIEITLLSKQGIETWLNILIIGK